MSAEVVPVLSTGIGSWPGADVEDAVKIAFAEAPDLPYLPELPARGPHAGLVGRSTALLQADRVEVTLDEPATGVAPGQAVVLYEGTRVVGGATIEGTSA